MTTAEENANRRGDWCAVLFALVFPTLLTVVYFVLLAQFSTRIQQGTYVGGKLIQFAFPALWIARVRRKRIGWSRPRFSELAWGTGVGLGLLAGALAIHHFGLKPAGIFGDAAGATIRKKIEAFGGGNIPGYVAIAVFYSLIHSLLEEYYWRWFVFGQLRRLTSVPLAIGTSSLGFMAHHVCIVSTFFGWLSPLSILLSAAVAGGGVIWAWLYHRTNSLIAPWISHAFVDAAIFLIGYDLVKDLFPP